MCEGQRRHKELQPVVCEGGVRPSLAGPRSCWSSPSIAINTAVDAVHYVEAASREVVIERESDSKQILSRERDLVA